jgi:hypothetical protein
MSLNDSVALYNFFRRYLWSSDDFTAFQQGMVDNVRNSLGALFGPALLTGGVITAGSGLSVNVTGFLAVGDDGYVHVKNSTTSNLALAAAHATLARKDLIVARKSLVNGTMISRPTAPFDSVALTTLQKTQVVVITGTPGASPAYPAKTAGDVVLGGVSVPATATVPGTIDATVKETTLGNQNFSNYYARETELELYGDGSDGDLTASSGTTTLTRDTFFNNVTLTGTAKINTNGHHYFVAGVEDLSNAGANAIHCNGNAGGNGSGTTGGTAAAVVASAEVGGSASTPTAGGAGAGSGGPGVQAAAVTSGTGNGGASGAGGKGGNGGGGNNGGASRAGASATNARSFRRIAVDLLFGSTLFGGGQSSPGGSGGGASNAVDGGGGGGGASGAGVLWHSAKALILSSSTAAGAIAAIGGAGGNGANGAVNNGAGGGAGAGGAGGGWVIGIFGSVTGAKSGVIAATGGAGGSGGNGLGSGIGGDGAPGGDGGRIFTAVLSTGVTQEVVGSAGSAGTAGSGTTGGAGGAGGACSASL